jgi:hypothetical protein
MESTALEEKLTIKMDFTKQDKTVWTELFVLK